MDLRERRQQEIAASMTKVAKVRARARPWRAIISLLVALAAAGVAINYYGAGHYPDKAFNYSGAAGFFVFGMAAAFGLSSTAGSRLRPAIGQAHAGIVRYAVLLIGLFLLLVVALELVQLPIANLVVGGAVTGVLLGIAAQQSLANLFAGLVLLFAHPFRVGDHVRFRAGTLSGQIEGVIIDISLTYVRLETDEGQVLIPNSQALSAAVLLVQQVAPSEDPPSPSLV